ncbi:DUF4433 domain-containing protein [Streptomyces sp. Je 1-79]|nr:DUF4433 domain-containing protein [Streptomyces sp. Je 1-79]
MADTAMQARGGVPVECGDRDVKSERRSRPVKAAPYGVPADYVPFYFAPRSPMLYKISRGGVPSYQEGQPPLVYLVTTIDDAVSTGRPYVFSDGNCANAITSHFNNLDLLPKVVDWDIISAHYWANTADDGDRMRRRMAEFLVHDQLEVTALTQVAVFDRGHADHVRALLRAAGMDLPVTVRREWYY